MSDARHTVSDLDVDIGQLFVSLLRNWLRILLVALAVAGLAFVLAGLATPLYRAETRILIESRESVYTRPTAAGIADSERALVDDEAVASQVEIIGSTDILREVADKLDLAANPEFGATGATSALGNLLILSGLKSDPSQASVEERVVRAMQERLSIYRVDGSRVIVVRFSSKSPALAAAVPNAIADAYVAQQEQAKRLSDAGATDWLKPEIEDLRRRVREAEARVAEYRAQTGLLIGQNNSVLPTQQLAEISTELTRASAERSGAEARVAAIRTAMGQGARAEAMPDVLGSPMVQRLRERQFQLEAEIADLSTSLLDNHPRMKAMRAQLDEVGRLVRAEVQKVLAAAENEVTAARGRESQLAAEVNRLKAASAQAGDDGVELHALEREATAERALLESYLTRYREAAARADRNSVPADARIFARATPPHQAYFPKKGAIVIAAFVAALLMTSIVILLRELFSGRAMRPAASAQVPVQIAEAKTSPETLSEPGPIETVSSPEAEDVSGIHPEGRLWDIESTMPDAEQGKDGLSDSVPAAEPVADEIAPPESEDDMARAGLKSDEFTISDAVNWLVEGDAERAIFISPQGDEATSTSVTVARKMADAGLRIIFVDLTWSGAPSAAMLESDSLPGVTNLLATQARFGDVIHDDIYSDCHVVPLGTTDPEQAMQAGDRLPVILDALDTAYDVVVVECGATDASAVASVAGEHAEIFVAALEADNCDALALLGDVKAAGYPEARLVAQDRRKRPDSRQGKLRRRFTLRGNHMMA